MSALSSNNASNASGLSVLSNRLRDITANGVFFTKSSKTCPNNMIPIASLLSHLAFLFTFIAKLGHLGRADVQTQGQTRPRIQQRAGVGVDGLGLHHEH